MFDLCISKIRAERIICILELNLCVVPYQMPVLQLRTIVCESLVSYQVSGHKPYLCTQNAQHALSRHCYSEAIPECELASVTTS